VRDRGDVCDKVGMCSAGAEPHADGWLMHVVSGTRQQVLPGPIKPITHAARTCVTSSDSFRVLLRCRVVEVGEPGAGSRVVQVVQKARREPAGGGGLGECEACRESFITGSGLEVGPVSDTLLDQ
jgi:hypothetical protein